MRYLWEGMASDSALCVVLLVSGWVIAFFLRFSEEPIPVVRLLKFAMAATSTFQSAMVQVTSMTTLTFDKPTFFETAISPLDINILPVHDLLQIRVLSSHPWRVAAHLGRNDTIVLALRVRNLQPPCCLPPLSTDFLRIWQRPI